MSSPALRGWGQQENPAHTLRRSWWWVPQGPAGVLVRVLPSKPRREVFALAGLPGGHVRWGLSTGIWIWQQESWVPLSSCSGEVGGKPARRRFRGRAGLGMPRVDNSLEKWPWKAVEQQGSGPHVLEASRSLLVSTSWEELVLHKSSHYDSSFYPPFWQPSFWVVSLVYSDSAPVRTYWNLALLLIFKKDG